MRISPSSGTSGLHEDPKLAYSEDLYKEVLDKKKEFEEMTSEQQFNQSEYDSEELNSALTYDEVSEAINKSKYRKSYLEIPNEILKNKNAKLLLFNSFSTLFLIWP